MTNHELQRIIEQAEQLNKDFSGLIAELKRQHNQKTFTCSPDPASRCTAWASGALDHYVPYGPKANWPASEAQLALLSQRNFHPPENVTLGEAYTVLSKPTVKQRNALQKMGLWYDEMTFTEAWEALNQSINTQ